MDILRRIYDHFKVEQILDYLALVPLFYLRPHHFFRSIFSRKGHEQVLAIVFYGTVEVFGIYIFIDDLTLRAATKGTILTVAAIVLLYPTLLLSHYLVGKFAKRSSSYKSDLLVFLLLSKLFLIPLPVTIWYFFVKTEAFEFYFVWCCLVVLMTSYYLIFSSYLFFSRMRHIIASIVLTVISVNIFIGLPSALRFDTRRVLPVIDEFPEPIVSEYNSLSTDLPTLRRFPYTRVVSKFHGFNFRWFLFADSRDSVAFGSYVDSQDFLKRLDSNFILLDSAIAKAKFNRNRELFQKWKDYYSNISNHINDTVPIKPDERLAVKRIKPISDEHSIDTIFILHENLFYLNGYYNIVSEVNRLHDMSEFASNPMSLIIVFFAPQLLFIKSD